MLLHGDVPVDDFMGLTPTELQHLLFDTYGDQSPVQLRDAIDPQSLDQIPLFRVVEEYLKIIERDKFIKLTPLGALPKKVMVEVYDKRFLLDDFIESGITKLTREHDWIAISSARLTAELAGLVRKVNGKLTLTKKAIKLLGTDDRSQLFKLFFQTFTEKFNWGFNDLLPQQPIGQFGWAFSLIMLRKYGDKPRPVTFYAECYLNAFPMLIQYFMPDYGTPEAQFYRCYATRAFARFFLWFGFVTADEKRDLIDIDTHIYTRTDLVKSVFR
jgi:hypothetical protein